MIRGSLWREQTGAAFAEFALVLPLVLSVVCGSIDFLYAFYQWNAAAKAVEVGARIAAVSDPVATGLNNLSNQAVLNGFVPGATMPYFTVTCTAGTCTCDGMCVGLAAKSFNSAAMDRIIYGPGNKACGEENSYHRMGMCDVLPSITAANVVITYTQTGLGYAGRPGGPIPTITVSLKDMHFHFIFLSFMFGEDMPMPAMTTTITAEDLCSGGGSGACGS
jgi:Flp pilus assembly protein TadG